MNRRSFVGLTLAAVGGVFAPQFGRWYKQGSGLLVPEGGLIAQPVYGTEALNVAWRKAQSNLMAGFNLKAEEWYGLGADALPTWRFT